MGSGRIRVGAFECWWAGLSELDRERARYFAATGDRLPRGLFLGLCDTNVLVLDGGYRATVADGSVPTFPMPSEIRAYVRHISVASPDFWPIAVSCRVAGTFED